MFEFHNNNDEYMDGDIYTHEQRPIKRNERIRSTFEHNMHFYCYRFSGTTIPCFQINEKYTQRPQNSMKNYYKNFYAKPFLRHYKLQFMV